jgi:hypothetical protein
VKELTKEQALDIVWEAKNARPAPDPVNAALNRALDLIERGEYAYAIELVASTWDAVFAKEGAAVPSMVLTDIECCNPKAIAWFEDYCAPVINADTPCQMAEAARKRGWSAPDA